MTRISAEFDTIRIIAEHREAAGGISAITLSTLGRLLRCMRIAEVRDLGCVTTQAWPVSSWKHRLRRNAARICIVRQGTDSTGIDMYSIYINLRI